MKDLRSRTVKAGGWVIGSQAVSQTISLAIGIVLARLLVPDDFGLVGMVMVFTGLASLLSNIGLGAALIQKRNINESHRSSIFWLNLILGGISSFLLFISAAWLSDFYQRPEVENICRALSVNLFLGALISVPRTLFAKELLFKYLALSDLLAMIISGIAAIILAIYGFGYWSLVINLLLLQVISVIAIWFVSNWRPRKGLSIASVRDLFSFSFYIFSTDLLQYGAKNVDKVILGKVFGGESLGIYDKALSMMLFPLQNISHVVGSVMFPSLSLIQADAERVKQVYLRSTAAVALVTFPMMVGMFVVSDSFVLGVLGEQWAELIPILKIFCLAGIASSIVTVTGVIYRSQGAAKLQFKVNLFTQPIKIASIIFGMPWGLQGVAIGYTVGLFINSTITLTFAGRLINLQVFTLLKTLAPMLFVALLMAPFVWVLRPVLGLQSELSLFLLQVIAGAIVYWILISAIGLKAYHDIAGVLRDEFLSKSRILPR